MFERSSFWFIRPWLSYWKKSSKAWQILPFCWHPSPSPPFYPFKYKICKTFPQIIRISGAGWPTSLDAITYLCTANGFKSAFQLFLFITLATAKSQPDVPDVRRRSRNSFLERFHLSFHPLLQTFCRIAIVNVALINTAVSIVLVTYSRLSRMPLR